MSVFFRGHRIMIPSERYWSFPFIALREGLVIHHKGWREKKKKNKRERRVSQSCTVPLPLPVGPDGPVDVGDIPMLQPCLPPVPRVGVMALHTARKDGMVNRLL
jgi:hypothetical protein